MRNVLVLCAILAATAPDALAQGHGDMFPISIESHNQGWAQVCYNPLSDEYLAVWEDYRCDESDVYGQFINGDGSLRGENFPLCASPGDQYWPRLDIDHTTGRYLVVFEDWRHSPNGDIRGVFLNADGTFFDAPTAEADHSFGICTNTAAVYTCAVAYSIESHAFLVVWGDFRNDPTGASFTGADVFGQIVRSDGTLMAPADPTLNFAVADHPDYDESVADVTFCASTMEWFVAYGTSIGRVMGQRVNAVGGLVDPSGAPSAQAAPLVVSTVFQNGPDCFQARVKSNCEGRLPPADWVECEVVWKGRAPDLDDNDVWGQRIGFFPEVGARAAKYVDINGAVTDSTSNHPISIQADWVGAPDIDYSLQDNEFLVAWGDPRTYGWAGQDLYYQRLWVDEAQSHRMVMLADDRVNTVNETENIPVFTTPSFEGSLLGIAHSIARNEFLVVFTYGAVEMRRTTDVMGVTAAGSPPVSVDGNGPLAGTLLLEPCRPNPFGSATTIRFTLASAGRATITMRDLNGRTVATVSDGFRDAGTHTLTWEATDNTGTPLPSGVYLCAIRHNGGMATRRVVVVR